MNVSAMLRAVITLGVIATLSACSDRGSARINTLHALAAANDARYGRGQVCPPTGRVEGFTVWRAPDHFTYAYTDAQAASLSLAQNVSQASRLGTPRCTFRDWVSPPFLR